jgi:hypothetical protein
MPLALLRIPSLLLAVAPVARAAEGEAASSGWLAWAVVGAIALFIAGVVVRMILAARFPKGYRHWAASKRDDFAARNERWDADDEEFRK